MYDETQIVQVREPDDFTSQFFTKERDLRTEEITNEYMWDMEKKAADREVSELWFGGMEASVADLADLYKEDIEQLEEETKKEVIKEEQLKVETDDPFFEKKFEEEKSTFLRRRLEEKDTSATRQPEHSRSTNYVVNSSGNPAYGNSGGYWSSGGYSSSSSNSTVNRPLSTPAGPKAGDKSNIMNDLGRAMGNTQNVAWNTPKLEPEQPKDGWEGYGKKNWWQKTKAWLKGKPGRVMVKVAGFMALQLGIALVSKKYVFDNWWQPVFFLSAMVGTFWMSKSLQQDGFDMRGLGI